MIYEDKNITWRDSYYDPPEDATYYVTIWVDPSSNVDAAIMAYMDANACTEETAALALIEAGFTALLENDALKMGE